MADVLVDLITSIDGYASGEGWPGWWGLEGPEYLQWLDQSPEKDWPILMGAGTYRLMSGFAAAAGAESDSFAYLDNAQKIVFSSSLDEPLTWSNSRLVAGDAVEAVRALKAGKGPGLRTLGSVSLARSLVAADLVDRFRVCMFPVITGRTGHERIYDDYPDVMLEQTDSRVFDGRIQLVEYRPRVLTGTPGIGA